MVDQALMYNHMPSPCFGFFTFAQRPHCNPDVPPVLWFEAALGGTLVSCNAVRPCDRDQAHLSLGIGHEGWNRLSECAVQLSSVSAPAPLSMSERTRALAVRCIWSE